MRYYIADCHFFHEEMIHKYDKRPFANMQEMTDIMVERWNEVVRKRDEVVILGDFSFGSAEQTNTLLSRLNGRLFMIIGNHDWVLHDKKLNTERFVWIHHYAEMKDNGRKVVLSHYPILCYNGQYHVDKKGNPNTYMLYGHVHDTRDQQLVDQSQELVRNSGVDCRMLNCFCMYSEYRPFTLDQWIAFHEKRLQNKDEESPDF